MQFRSLLLLCLLLVVFFSDCTTKKQQEENKESTADEKFEDDKRRWAEKFWKLDPVWATSQGYHKYDSMLVIPDAGKREARLVTYQNMLAELQRYKPEELSVLNQIDYRLLDNFIHYNFWLLKDYRSFEWDPSVYNLGSSVAEILNGRHDSLSVRLRAISHKITKAPVYYEIAIATLQKPTLEHTQLAILQNRGGAEVFGQAMLDSVERSTLKPAEKELLRQRIATAKLAIDGYVRFLENQVLPTLGNGKGRSFRLGKELYDQKFQYEIQASN